MAVVGGWLQWLSGSVQELPVWLAGIDTCRLAMMMVAVPGPRFCLLVLTMPLGGNSDRRPLKDAAAGGPAMIGFVPYARSQWRTLAYFFAVVLVINFQLSSSLTGFPLALPRACGIDPATARTSEEARVGEEWVRTCRSRGSEAHK